MVAQFYIILLSGFSNLYYLVMRSCNVKDNLWCIFVSIWWHPKLQSTLSAHIRPNLVCHNLPG